MAGDWILYRDLHPPPFGKGAFMEGDVMSGCVEVNDKFLDVLGCINRIFHDAVAKAIQEVPRGLSRDMCCLSVHITGWIELKKTKKMNLFTETGIPGNLTQFISEKTIG